MRATERREAVHGCTFRPFAASGGLTPVFGGARIDPDPLPPREPDRAPSPNRGPSDPVPPAPPPPLPPDPEPEPGVPAAY